MADLPPGKVLADRFEVIGTLGRGGMATVYLARDTVRDEKVAVKVLHDHLAHDPSMRRRLRREVHAAGLVRHEAALVAHDLHVADGTLALSMPFHGGATLTEHVRSHGPLSEQELRDLGVRIAGALSDAHRQGVLHRDVSPNNVMLHTPADAVLTDFGLARSVDEHTATATSVLGTPGYAAPETYHGQRTDPRSDLYSLGAVLYFAATGRSPFGSGSPAAILQAQLAGNPEPVSELRPDLPADVVQTIGALLQGDSERRPPGASEVGRALSDQRAALVPEVPDTWDPKEEPLLLRSQAASLPAPAELPVGEWEVILQGRRGCDAQRLADGVGGMFDLPAGTLEVTRPMRTRSKKFVLTRATDKATAQRLAEAARVAGYRAQLVDSSPPSLAQRLVGLLPVLIPILWVAFPFYTLPMLGLELSLVLSIGATIFISGLAGALGRARPDEDLALALTGDLSQHMVGTQDTEEDLDDFIDGLGLPSFLEEIAHEVASDVDIRTFAEKLRRGFVGRPTSTTPPVRVAREAASPAAPQPEARAPERTRAEGSRARALGHLDLLQASIDTVGDALPEVARDDLRRTAASLREHAVELSRGAVGLEAALASTPEPEDVSWIHSRLARLETLERTGESVDEGERARLRAAVRSAEDAEAARSELESRLTSALAQLLEIGAIASRARADLHGGADVPATAVDLHQQLNQQVEAVDAMRREMGVRRKAAQAAQAAKQGRS